MKILNLFLLCIALFQSAISLPAASPGPPFALQLAPQSLRSDELTLFWDKVRIPEGTVTYEVVRDGKVIGSTDKTFATASGNTPGREHLWSIRALVPGREAPLVSNSLKLTMKDEEPVISVLDHGAVGDGKTLDTEAIQAAIEACPKGGVVRIPKGTFLSGALFLKSDMTLEIGEGGVLKGSTNLADYEPLILNRFEGWELETYASLINAGKLDRNGPANVENISIRGRGTISGGGEVLGNAMIEARGLRGRGRLICIMNARNVEFQGLTLEETPCWTLHYIYSENVTINNLTFHSNVRNGDGIDPDSSVNSYIFNCTFTNDDDCIAIKSGKNPEGNVVNRPTENVRIVGCNFIKGHGISIGSEMSGGVRNVLVEDCVAGDLLNGLQVKGTKDRGGFVEDVVVRDCDLRKISILTDLAYNNDGEPAPEQPVFRNFRFLDLDMSQADPSKPVIIVNGFPDEGHETRDLLFENIVTPEVAVVIVDRAEDVTFRNVQSENGTRPIYEVTRSEGIDY